MKKNISLFVFILFIVTSASSQSKKAKSNTWPDTQDWFQMVWDAKAGGYLEDACLYFQKYIEKGNSVVNVAIAYANWGNTLVDMSRRDNDESLLVEALEKHKKSVELRPEGIYAYNSLATIYVLLADKRNDASLYKEAIDNFQQSNQRNPHTAYSCGSMGYAMLKLAKLNNTVIADKDSITEVLTEANSLGSKSAAYNLICVYSLCGDTDEAFHWLDIGMKNSPQTKAELIKDSDLDNIRSDVRFQQVLDSAGD